jgi:hypothetical protein
MVFFDNLGRLLACVDSVNIGLLPDFDIHRLSPGTFDLGAFIFDSMLDLTTSPATRSATMIWRRLQVYNALDVNNHIHHFIAPPRVMVRFDIPALVPRPLLVVARRDAWLGLATGDILYYLFVCIGNLQYCFEFAPLQTRHNVILIDPIDGCITCYLEAIWPEGALPPDGVDNWIVFRHEDAPREEGGILSHAQHGSYSLAEKIGQLGPKEGAPPPLPPRQPSLAACPRPGARPREEGAPPSPVPPSSSTTTISSPSWFWKESVKLGSQVC